MTALPFSSVHSPQASRQAALEFSRWMMPPFSFALPEIVAGDALRGLGRPVGAHVGEDSARLVSSSMKSMPMPLSTSFGREDHRLLRAFEVEG